MGRIIANYVADILGFRVHQLVGLVIYIREMPDVNNSMNAEIDAEVIKEEIYIRDRSRPASLNAMSIEVG